MSTSLMSNVWGIRDCSYVKAEHAGGCSTFHVKPKQNSLLCPECGSSEVICKGTKHRSIKTVPVGARQTYIALQQQRIRCKTCDTLAWLTPKFVKEGCRHSKAFARYVLCLLEKMNIKDVSQHLRVSWTYVKDIQKEYLGKHFGKPKLKHVRYLGIDEVSIGHGHRYFTIVLDLEGGEVLFVGDGKGSDALLPFWKRLRRAGTNIKAVATDLSAAYISAVRKNLPQAVHVFDHFHVVKLMNEKLSKLRRDLYNELTDKMQKKVLKGTRWLLLKNPENLEEEKGEAKNLAEALKLNEPLAMAYYMKEDLRQIWRQENKRAAEQVLTGWIKAAQLSGVKILQDMGKCLATYRSGILNWYDFPLTTAALEGTNNKIGMIQRVSYGIKDKEFLKLKIYACKRVRYSLVG